MKSLWKFFTSLRLTVVLLALGLLLVFFGTLAQVHEGLWNALGRWFRSILVVRHAGDAWWVPPIFPGGYLIGAMLLLNLLAAHIKRFQWSSKKIGINLTHFGIILFLVGELATALLSRESFMSFHEGETRNYSEAQREHELVFATDAGNGQEQVVSIPGKIVAKKGEISDAQLPFTVRVKDYSVNGDVLLHSEVKEASGTLTTALATLESQYATVDSLVPQSERAEETPGRTAVWQAALKAVGETDTSDIVAAATRVAADPNREGKLREELKKRFQSQMLEMFSQKGGAMRFVAQKIGNKEQLNIDSLPRATTQGTGLQATALPHPEAKDMDGRNLPFATLEIVTKAGQSLGTWLVWPFLKPQEFQVEGKTFRTAFRFERYYNPFSVTLLKTTHEVYRGTNIPKNYQSRVRIDNPKTGEAREVDIYMNNPLRYGGLTFYQSQMDRFTDPGFSGLQVVRNPSWITPYLGCLLVGGGMTWQFLYHLIGFSRKRNKPEAKLGTQKSSKRQASLAKA
ncbi:cytochrome c biogenesis protein ResB [Verrucomicrobiota bacterium sgz303538]